MSFYLPSDILQLIFDELVGDCASLADVGLVCRSWRTLSLPHLLTDVDLSCHNDGRLPEHESDVFPLVLGVVMADQSDKYRPASLLPRQRAFLRLMVDRPGLSGHVKAFTWTLLWMNHPIYAGDDLTDIDRRTWEVFKRMENVARLDLASLHDSDCYKPEYTRQNPVRLFPAVTDLRLVGWMHRGLARAIITSLDPSKLRRLSLNHLQDEGALPNGEPIPQDLATKHRREVEDCYADEGIDDELFKRQECGDAAIFPGPMWFLLRSLRQNALTSMSHLEILLDRFTDHDIDQRNYVTMFCEISEFIRSAKDTLKTISIEVGEHPALHCDVESFGNSQGGMRWARGNIRGFTFHQSSAFLHRLLPVLTAERFPRLTRVNLEGFRIIQETDLGLRWGPDPSLTWQYIRDCPFVNEDFVKTPNYDYRSPFIGYDTPLEYVRHVMGDEEFDRVEGIVARS